MHDRYDPKAFESSWQQKWRDAKLFETRLDPGKPKFYGLDFFPYPSGAGLSVGHCRNYIPTDVLCRLKSMQGYNVLHPMGFDAFGLPAENEAIKRKRHPAIMIDEYAANYERQMNLVGISYDWSRSFKSCDPSYYKWTQWIFGLLYQKGLAYRADAPVNWCPKDKTALANEEVVAGCCERCGTAVEKRNIPQWYFKITAYAQRLIDDLDTIDWPEGIKQMQRNWIGRSEGVEFEMAVRTTDGLMDTRASLSAESSKLRAQAGGSDKANELLQKMAGAVDDILAGMESVSGAFDSIQQKVAPTEHTFRVFTTRIDTIFGMTFCVLAPEHPLIEKLKARMPLDNIKAVIEYQAAAKAMSDVARQNADRTKTGVFTGLYATNPANGLGVPIYIADYVLMGYGTGAIMAVPGHDQRDFDFAKAYGIEIKPVIAPSASGYQDVLKMHENGQAFEAKDGFLVNSGEYDGMSVAESQKRLGEWIEALGIGERKVNYKLRDWLISRQRYWGCPIPIIHSESGDMQLVPESDLPVLLPDVEHYEPTDDGSSPLTRIESFVNVTDRDGRLGKRETDTMGGFACSSWYFLRFCDPHNDEKAWSPESIGQWMPVDCYVGGAEHAVMHLLYARFWTKVLYDLGLVSVQEPFQKLLNQGQVLAQTPYRQPREGEVLDIGEDGILMSFEDAATMKPEELMWRWVRMSKSKGNVVIPDEMVDQFGADALRIYELFVAPFDQDVQWATEGVNGASRFLSRVFKWMHENQATFDPNWRDHVDGATSDWEKELRRATHLLIDKATQDIERFAFNTYISAMMIFLNTVNDLAKTAPEPSPSSRAAISEAMEALTLVLAPAAPHSADELWTTCLGKEGFTFLAKWPRASAALMAASTVTIAIQMNGKLRDTMDVAAAATQAELEQLALAREKVKANMDGKTVRKVIVVPGKLVNIVVG